MNAVRSQADLQAQAHSEFSKFSFFNEYQHYCTWSLRAIIRFYTRRFDFHTKNSDQSLARVQQGLYDRRSSLRQNKMDRFSNEIQLAFAKLLTDRLY